MTSSPAAPESPSPWPVAPWHDPAVGSGRLTGWPQWTLAVREAMALAAGQAADLWWMATDFSRWPLGERADVEAWSAWAAAGRHTRAVLLAADWPRTVQAHPRWARWQPTWAHRVSCRALSEEDRSSLQAWVPTLVVADCLALEVLDEEEGSGRWTRNPVEVRRLVHQVDAISQRSSTLTPGTSFGL